MKRTYFEFLKKCLRILYICLLLLLNAIVFFAIWKTDYVDEFYGQTFEFRDDMYLTVLYMAVFFLFLCVFDGEKLGYLRGKSSLYTQVLSSICADVVSFFLIILALRQMPDFLPILKMMVLDIVIGGTVTLGFEQLFSSIFPPRRLLLIYGNTETEQIGMKMKGRRDRFVIAGKLSASESLETIEKEISKYDGIVLSDVRDEKRNHILKYCYGHSIRVYMTPKLSDVMIRSAEMLHIFDAPLLLSRNYGLSIMQRILKRLMDVVISFILIIMLSPLMLVVSIVIKVYDGGPVLFLQTRLTKNHREFHIYKFRSMVMGAEKEGEVRLAAKNDDRITPIGEIIRRTRIDELPQLFNVLFGDMSLVGPRPERPEFVEEYEKDMPEFAFRLDVKAGLTGYAQVYGKYNTTPYDKLKMDLIYIENYSLWEDCKILLMTLKVIFIEESAEGIDEG